LRLEKSQCDSYIRFFEKKVKKKIYFAAISAPLSIVSRRKKSASETRARQSE